jgi:hypothetical protein
VANLVQSVRSTGTSSRPARRSRLTVTIGPAPATRDQANAPADADWGLRSPGLAGITPK